MSSRLTLGRPLRVVLVWNGEALEERHFNAPENIRIGSRPSDTFSAPESDLGRSFTLFRAVPGGFALELAPSMHGNVSLGGRELTISEQLQRSATAPLSPSDWGIVALDRTGEIAFFFQFVAATTEKLTQP